MAFCSKCGSKVEDGAKFCNKCGAVMPESGTAAPSDAAGQQDGASKASGLGDVLKDLNQTADTTNAHDLSDIAQNKTMALLSYLGILVLIPIFAAPGSKFARYHANQGLILAICWIVYSIAFSIVRSILLAITPILGFIVSILSILNVVFVVLAVIGIMNAVQGRAKELPVIGKFQILK
ncbi:MAG: zinc-ribbon domain-containing protein [Eubacteriales bacterium]|nr:zinc-ribbon domain-containing protein [Eubacteriales bacterium]